MSSNHTKKAQTAGTANANTQSKSTTKLQQLQKVYGAYYESPLTMKECDRQSGIMRESICRYNKMLRDSNTIYYLGKRYCMVTKHLAGVYTINPKLVPINSQLNLFDNGQG
jgi:hypothetical protein